MSSFRDLEDGHMCGGLMSALQHSAEDGHMNDQQVDELLRGIQEIKERLPPPKPRCPVCGKPDNWLGLHLCKEEPQ